jgi:hypothetical protein
MCRRGIFKPRRPHLDRAPRIAATKGAPKIHHIRISTDGEINAAVKFEGLLLLRTSV